MPPERPTARTPRRLALAAAPFLLLMVVMTTAACGSGRSGPSSDNTVATPSRPLAPWTGTFAGVALPSGIHSLADVSCPTAARCVAVGSTLATASASALPAIVSSTNGGLSWVTQTVPTSVTFLSKIACTSARACTAVGQTGTAGAGPGAIISTSNGGTTWTLQTVPTGTTDVTAITCPPGGHCTALADVAGRVTALATTGTGGAWVAGGALPATVSAGTDVSCTDVSHCWATGISPIDVGHVSGIAAATADGGTTWTLQPVPTGTGPLRSVSCARAAASSDSTSTTSATSSVTCTAVGTTATVLAGARTGQGVVLTTTNGGTTWVSTPAPANSADLVAVSCSAGPCVAVGTTVASSPQAGIVVLTRSATAGARTWRRLAVATVPLPLSGVSCLSLSACVVVGESYTAHLAAG